ncbi:MAG: cupin domain-containing protein [Fuerstiella sp.]|nr:cupin domain-containing protein [Fuerstiella sp.]
MSTLSLQVASGVRDELPDMPIPPSLIVEGNPVARGAVLTQSEDRKISSGIWSCEPGKFEWTYDWDEFIHVLEGEVEITADETERIILLRSGDTAHFPLGMKAQWHVKKRVRKFFVIRTPEPFAL